MTRRPLRPLLALAALAALATPAAPGDAAPPLPRFDEPRPERWMNSGPLTVDDLRGHVVLVDVWTFGCVNCVRTLPWIRDLRDRYAGRGLVVVGVHAPEFDVEKNRAYLRAFNARQGVDWPILLDDEHAYWDRLGNRYWPTLYLVDRGGRIRAVHVGETHAGTPAARDFERKIEAVLEGRS